MLIVRNKKSVLFSEIKCGEVFETKDESFNVYLKIAGDNNPNVFNLGLNQCDFFGPDEVVFVVPNAKLVLE